MAEDLGERTEQPTERRLSESRSKGKVARSTDLSAAITLTAVVVVCMFMAEYLLRGMALMMRAQLNPDSLGEGITLNAIVPEIVATSSLVGRLIAPVMIILTIASFVGAIYQVGWNLSAEAIQPKWNKLNLFTNFKNLANKRAGVKGGLDLLKFVIIASVAIYVVRDEYREVLALANLDLMTGLMLAAELAQRLALWVLLVLIILGIIDFKYQTWQHRQDLKMTRQEVKEERKSSEGDMETKARRMKLARQIALQRIGMDVPKADVIVTNPTHYAVALKYDAESGMRAPRVIAKGADYVALKMRYIAVSAGVPIVERPPLARALYSQVKIGQEIFPEHYEAVAEVLAYVYRIENQLTG